jgi:biotin operon repressor
VESRNCYVCGKGINTKNELGINTQYFYCYDCLANKLEITEEELFAKMEEFKNQGCTLFELSR